MPNAGVTRVHTGIKSFAIVRQEGHRTLLFGLEVERTDEDSAAARHTGTPPVEKVTAIRQKHRCSVKICKAHSRVHTRQRRWRAAVRGYPHQALAGTSENDDAGRAPSGS